MPYKLLLSEEISPAIRRMALEQLTKARRELSAADNIHVGVHKTRACLKRLRSLIRLARPLIGEDLFKSENRIYRDLARALARPRDAGAKLETLVKFEAREDLSHLAPLFSRLNHMISKEKKVIESELEIVSLAALVETLDDALVRWKQLPMKEARFEALAHGFGRTYERGRKDLRTALQHDDSFYLHEWRKSVQQTWRHLQILTLIWPDDVMPRIKLAHEISRLLGAEHDISELLDYMKVHRKKLTKKHKLKSQYKSFQLTATAIQRDLCLLAIERGRRLYAFEAEAISKAMTIYWQSSRAMQPIPSLVLELAQIGPIRNEALSRMRASQKKPAAKNRVKSAGEENTAPSGHHKSSKGHDELLHSLARIGSPEKDNSSEKRHEEDEQKGEKN